MEEAEFWKTAQRKEHLRGWLSYAFASEVFVVVSLTLFLPICLEQFARDNGMLLPDRIMPCNTIRGQPDEASPGGDERRCSVKIGWLWIDTASFSLYVYSASVALQALTVISMGCIADRPTYRKRLLVGFASMGAAAATLFLMLPSSSILWPLSGLLAMMANVGFGASIVAMNAYLPFLARESVDVIQFTGSLDRRFYEAASDELPATDDRSNAPLLVSSDNGLNALRDGPHDQQEYNKALSKATSRISSQGIALGYAAGIALLILALVPVTLMKGSTLALRLAIGASGIWWALGTIPAAIWLPSSEVMAKAQVQPGWDDPSDEDEAQPRVLDEVLKAWRRLITTLHPREISDLRNTFKYLAAWFLLSDGFTTITSTAILFGKTALGMSASRLIIVGVLTPSAGILGAIVWPRIQTALGWSNLRVLVVLVALASLIPAYGCLGFLPVFKNGNVKFGGLTTQEEMYGLAVYFGAVYGAFQAYARALYAELIPPGEEARWYGLFSITDKSSSFLGPLIVGLIADSTGNIRYSFFFLVVMVWAAIPILSLVDVSRGKEDAVRYSRRARQ